MAMRIRKLCASKSICDDCKWNNATFIEFFSRQQRALSIPNKRARLMKFYVNITSGRCAYHSYTICNVRVYLWIWQQRSSVTNSSDQHSANMTHNWWQTCSLDTSNTTTILLFWPHMIWRVLQSFTLLGTVDFPSKVWHSYDARMCGCVRARAYILRPKYDSAHIRNTQINRSTNERVKYNVFEITIFGISFDITSNICFHNTTSLRHWLCFQLLPNLLLNDTVVRMARCLHYCSRTSLGITYCSSLHLYKNVIRPLFPLLVNFIMFYVLSCSINPR